MPGAVPAEHGLAFAPAPSWPLPRLLDTSSVATTSIVPVATSTSGFLPVTVTSVGIAIDAPAITHHAALRGSESHISSVSVLMSLPTTFMPVGADAKHALTRPVP